MNLYYKNASAEHEELIFTWVNDPLVRKFSFNTNEITRTEHGKWFQSLLNDDSTFYLIFYSEENNPVGQVRINQNGPNLAKIGVLVNSQNRGKGYAAEIIRIASELYIQKYPEEIIEAYIKEENIGSIKAFIKAGYRPTNNSKEKISNTKTLIYGHSN